MCIRNRITIIHDFLVSKKQPKKIKDLQTVRYTATTKLNNR